MLKNEGVLPLTNVKSVAVVGPMSDAGLDQMGTWSLGADPNFSITPLAAIRSEYPNIIVNAARVLAHIRVNDMKEVGNAVEVARNSDVVLLCAGEAESLSADAICFVHFSLQG